MVRASVEEVPKLKVPELKAELKAYGLDVKGKKAELSARLLEHLHAQETQTDTTSATAPNAGPDPSATNISDNLPADVDSEATPGPAVAEGAAGEARLVTDAPAVNSGAGPTTDNQKGPTVASVPSQSSDDGGKRRKKKRGKRRGYREPTGVTETSSTQTVQDPKVQIEYVAADVNLAEMDGYGDFEKIFEKFKVGPTPTAEVEMAPPPEKVEPEEVQPTVQVDEDSDDEGKVEKMSKSKLRKLNRLTVAELKQLVNRPDVVEVHDVTAADPKLLVHLKAHRNTVPVPRHWLLKRKYLQGKRGIEKPPFDLPDFIKKTGIQEMREAISEKEDRQGLKGKQREKTRPKMGKMEIDYQKLHDAFFRWQTKPKMSIHGDLYYEGKEFETKVVDAKPGELSENLKIALGMPVDSGAVPIPPPWLLHMQRYGPPPSYPNLKIPGLNAPIPEGATFGYHPGGWGKPPVDAQGRPLYGDVFAASNRERENEALLVGVDTTTLWGQLESEEEEEDESSEEEGSDEEVPEEQMDESGTLTESGTTSVSESGITSIGTGMETPDALELRKRRQQIEDAMDDTGESNALYKVLPTTEGGSASGGFLAGGPIYDMGSVVGGKKRKGIEGEGIDITVDPTDLATMDKAKLQEQFDAAKAEKDEAQGAHGLSDMAAEHIAKTAKKRKADSKKDKAAKKFKF